MNFVNDLRFGLRSMRKAPGFALTAVVTMALGIGATTAIYSVSDAMLWKPVPVPHLETLVTIVQRNPETTFDFDSVTAADIADIGRQADSIGPIATWQNGLANLAGAGAEPERAIQYLVSANFFDVIGVQPAIGRGFRPGENEPGRQREIVLSDALWRRRYGADPNLLGKTIRVDDEDYVVIGIAPRKFVFPKASELWTPYALTNELRNDRRGGNFTAGARLKPGRTLADLSAELDVIGTRLAAQYPETNRVRRFMAWSAHRYLIGEYNRRYLGMLFYAVLFVLLIACVNVANLQFARATGRMREVALRTALGASRAQIVAQLVTESLLLALAGAALGLGVAYWGLDLIRAGMPAEVARYIVGWNEINLDGRALLFTCLAALAAGVLSGLAPAWQSSRPDLAGALKEGGRTSAGRARHRLRHILVAAEVSLAVVLLIGAGLMVRGFDSLVHAATAVEPSTILTLRLALTDAKYREPYQQRAFYNAVLERAAAIPGVRAAVAALALPHTDHWTSRGYRIEGRLPDPTHPVESMYQSVTAGYFAAMHIPLRAGRFFDTHDGAGAPRVAVISERMAQRYWPGEPPPLGKRIRTGTGNDAQWTTIVGVAGDVMYDVMERSPHPVLYVPFEQDPHLWMDIGLRTAGDPARYGAAITAAVRSVDPEQPVTYLFPMDT
ncbi:MAG: ABC transporter permease, partial [Acidobacteria bacterium]|nr:ABC transporter permease [Acidobacteriota bacterium]